MRKYLIILLIGLIFTTPIYSQRKKVGVVLMGGGAKGFAHIGALKVLEEAGIPIDYIAGTSMGAIIGGLYSIGYDAHKLDSLVQHQDWVHLLSDDVYRYNLTGVEKEKKQTYIASINYQKKGISLPAGIVSGQNVLNLLLDLTTGYHENINFINLPIPFSCVAADAKTGKEVILNHGSLPISIRSSMAIPGVFNPVKLDTMLLIDGGVLNNYPVDVVRKMGADIVIGISFENDKKSVVKDEGSLLEFTHEFSNFLGKEKFDENIRNTDLNINVNLDGYNISSFESEAIDSIVNRGENKAREKWDDMMNLKKTIELPNNYVSRHIVNPYIGLDTLHLRSAHIEGLSPQDELFVLNSINISPKFSRSDLQTMISKLYGTDLFSKVYYRLENTKPPYDLVLEVEKKDNRNLNIGVRFDTDDLASILLNTVIRLNSSINSTFDITARLNKNPYVMLDYSLKLLIKGGLRLKTQKNDIFIYNRGKLAYNLGFIQNSMDINFSSFYFYNLKLNMGANFDYFYYLFQLKSTDQKTIDLKSKPYFNYFINGTYDNLNSSFFPSKGTYFNFRYAIKTDNFYQMDRMKPLQDLSFTLIQPIAINNKICVTPNINGRVLIGDTVPIIYSNLVGGQFDNQYVNQQISLQGLQGMEFFKKSIVKTQLDIRYSFYKKHTLQFAINYTLQHDNLFKILEGKSIFGGTLGYSYNTLLGPINFRLSYSNWTKKIYPFLSVGYYF
ncbi:MAG: hypothetical protein H6Q18_302 [Bacteroidetes bacterium]|nr:hypothetical protein [Bacteroidota bacterium]